MSYDLWFRARDASIDLADLEAYFRDRPLFRVEDDYAQYWNEDTGVDFCFYLEEREIHRVNNRIPCAFNLNYFRPHVFGLEAELELTGFVGHFDLDVDDPQISGMADGVYSPEGFLRGWNAGNAFSYLSYTADTGRPPRRSLHQSHLEGVWNWNYYRQALMGASAARCFAPAILLLVFPENADRIVPCSIWSGEEPTLLLFPDIVEEVMLVSEHTRTRFVSYESVRDLLTDVTDITHIEASSEIARALGEPILQTGYSKVWWPGEPSTGLRDALWALPGREYDRASMPLRETLDRVLTKELLDAAQD